MKWHYSLIARSQWSTWLFDCCVIFFVAPSKSHFACRWLFVLLLAGLGLGTLDSWKDETVNSGFVAVDNDEAIKERHRQKTVKLAAVGESEEFGVPTELTLLDAEGIQLGMFNQSGVIEEMLLLNISVLFRHRREGKEETATVVGVYPKVFTAGCIVVVEIDGPGRKN